MEPLQRQYIRQCQLVVSTAGGSGFDLSALSIIFKVKKTEAQTPNTAEVRVYNIDSNTAARIQKEFSLVTLQAGYPTNLGVIFEGNIKQVKSGAENGIDTFIDIAAGDGDLAYNYAVVNTTLAAGSRQVDQINAAQRSMAKSGVRPGYISDIEQNKLPRGKVMYGMARDYLRQSAEACESSWSIQDGGLQVLKKTDTLKNTAVVLNSATGLIGHPEQTNDGIKIRCLLNPQIKVGGVVKINEKDIGRVSSPQANQFSGENADGFYRVLCLEHSGETRGQDWYTDLICIDLDSTKGFKKQ